MAKTKTQKQESLKTIADIFKTAKSIVFTGFDKLTVSEVTDTRKVMRATGVRLVVVKKSLLTKALKESSYAQAPEFSGQIALAYGDDAFASAREVYQAGKKLENKLSILGGIFEGKLTDKETMLSIATIPSREVLLAQLVNLINSPIQGFVVGLNAIAAKRG